MRRTILCLLLLAMATAGGEPKRPKILGVAHMALYVSDLAKARVFYRDFMGYGEPYVLKRKDGADRIAFIKINEDQYLELFAEEPQHNDGQLNHISVETDDANAMREYLAAKGVKTPDRVGKGQIKNSNFNVIDPDGHTVEIVQYERDSWTRDNKGKFLPDTRISTHMTHVGIVVGPLERSMKFYRDILGFQEIWRGGGSPRMLSWVNMRVPEGQDYLEFMLYNKPPDKEQLGVKHHICLVVWSRPRWTASPRRHRQRRRRCRNELAADEPGMAACRGPTGDDERVHSKYDGGHRSIVFLCVLRGSAAKGPNTSPISFRVGVRLPQSRGERREKQWEFAAATTRIRTESSRAHPCLSLLPDRFHSPAR
jgi:lactoylglutathione lyase